MARLRMLRPGEFPTLRWSLFCGEPLPRSLAEAWAETAPNSTVENLYGPTEATISFTAFRLPARAADRAGLPETIPIGQPFDGLQTAVIGEDGAPVPDGQAGELCLGGAQVADGYWRRPDLTAERFAPPSGFEADGMNWYRTGDRVASAPEYGFVFLGRTDAQAKIAGYRVELQEVEEVVRRVAKCDSVAALPWPLDADGFARGLVAFVAHSAASDDAILAACRDRLPPYMVPSRVHRIPNWPLNPNGKTDRRAIAALAQEMA
jgi:acyl-CoA synthetase (AMP-forming)/AMP-acid ligase II